MKKIIYISIILGISFTLTAKEAEYPQKWLRPFKITSVDNYLLYFLKGYIISISNPKKTNTKYYISEFKNGGKKAHIRGASYDAVKPFLNKQVVIQTTISKYHKDLQGLNVEKIEATKP